MFGAVFGVGELRHGACVRLCSGLCSVVFRFVFGVFRLCLLVFSLCLVAFSLCLVVFTTGGNFHWPGNVGVFVLFV